MKPTYAFPNPFAPRQGDLCRIVFGLASAQSVKIQIYDPTMHRVNTLDLGELQPANKHIIEWDGKGSGGEYLPNGTYFYMIEPALESGSKELYNKIVILN